MSGDQYLQSIGVKPDEDSRELLFTVMSEEAVKEGVPSDKIEKLEGGAKKRPAPPHAWKPGQSGNPQGRKSRQYERDMVESIKRVLTPENIEKYLNIGLDLAVEQRSTRGIIAVLELGLAYGAGKPVQQVVGDSGKTELLEQLLASDKPLLPPEQVPLDHPTPFDGRDE